jgi:cyclophilin family peptidyl-prolyl cis-trans isomerase
VYILDTSRASGDIGRGVSPGLHKSILWNAVGQLGPVGLAQIKILALPQHALGAVPVDTMTIFVSSGEIRIALFPAAAPRNVARVESLAGMSFYNGKPFHRIVRGRYIQLGDTTPGCVTTVPAEFNELGCLRGAVAMARKTSDTANPTKASSGNQLFVVLDDRYSWTYDNVGYTVIGRVVQGMQIVDRIADSPLLPKSTTPETPILVDNTDIKHGTTMPVWASPSPVYPANRSKVVDACTLRMMPVPDADWYHFRVRNADGSIVRSESTTNSWWAVTPRLDTGSYRWDSRYHKAAGWSPYFAPDCFFQFAVTNVVVTIETIPGTSWLSPLAIQDVPTGLNGTFRLLSAGERSLFPMSDSDRAYLRSGWHDLANLMYFGCGIPGECDGRLLPFSLAAPGRNYNRVRSGDVDLNTLDPSFRLNLPFSSGAVNLSGQRSVLDWWSSAFGQSFPYFHDLSGTGTFALSDQARLALFGSWAGDNVNVVGESASVVMNWASLLGGLAWSHDWSTDLYSRTCLIYSKRSFDLQYLMRWPFAEAPETATVHDQVTEAGAIMAELSWVISRDKGRRTGEVRIGAEGDFSLPYQYTTRSLTQKSPTTISSASTSGACYAQGNIEIGPNCMLAPGIRLDYRQLNNATALKPGGGLSLTYRVSEKGEVVLSWANHAQFTYALFPQLSPIPALYFWEPSEQPQTINHFRVGLASEVGAGLRLDVAGYFKLHNLVLEAIDTGSMRPVSSSNAKSYGAEVSLTRPTGPLAPFINYSFADFSGGIGLLQKSVRKHVVGLGVTYSVSGLDLTGRWNYGTALPRASALGGFGRHSDQSSLETVYNSLDAGFGWTAHVGSSDLKMHIGVSYAPSVLFYYWPGGALPMQGLKRATFVPDIGLRWRF